MFIPEPYVEIDAPLVALAHHNITYTSLTSEERKALRLHFMEQKPVRKVLVEKLLKSNELPISFQDEANLLTVEQWCKENIESNGVPLINSQRNHLIEMENMHREHPLPLLPQREISTFWNSVLFDLAVKLGEDKIGQFPHLKWKMQTWAPRMVSYNRMCLVGFTNGDSKTSAHVNLIWDAIGYFGQNVVLGRDTLIGLHSAAKQIDAWA